MKKLLIILLSIQMLFALNIKDIKKGDIIEDSVKHLEKKYYKIDIESQKDIQIKLTNLNQDVDLYVRTETFYYGLGHNNMIIENQVPTLRRNDCFSSNSKTKDEECRYQVWGPAPGSYDQPVYIMVYGFKSSSYKLEVTEVEHKRIDILTTNTTRDKVKKGENKQYKVHGKAGETIKVSLFDLTADADLRVKIGTQARKNHFDCKSTKGKRKTDSCSVTLKKDDWVYVHVDGYRSADYSIKIDAPTNQNQALINKVKEHCLNIDNNTDDVLCSKKEHLAYILEKEGDNDVIHIIATQNHKYFEDWEYLGKTKLSTHGDKHTFSLHKLKNTRLFYTKSSNSKNLFFNFYYSDEHYLKLALGEFSIPTEDMTGIKTYEHGKKMFIKYYRPKTGNDSADTYDISDISNIKIEKNTINRCTLEPKAGHCRGAFRRYYFDNISKSCKEYIYGGCGEIVPFKTLDKCKSSCEVKTTRKIQ